MITQWMDGGCCGSSDNAHPSLVDACRQEFLDGLQRFKAKAAIYDQLQVPAALLS